MTSYLTVKEITKLFRLKKEETVRTWIKRGLFPNAIYRGGYLIPSDDVAALIEQSAVSKIHPPEPKPPKKPALRGGGFVKNWT